MKISKSKLLVRKFRDYFSQIIENIFIQVCERVSNNTNGEAINIILASREGRGTKIALEDDVFFRELKKIPELQHEIMRYNKKLWIIDSLSLIWKCRKSKKIKVVLISYVPEFHKFPSMKLLSYLQSYGVEIIKIWFDSSDKKLWTTRILRMSELGNKNYIVDTPLSLSKYGNLKNSYLYIPPPIETFNFIPIKERKYFIYYSGGISNSGSYNKREQILRYLLVNGVSIEGTTYDREKPVARPTYDQYRRNLAASLCGLNFTWKDEVDVLPARTWEILTSGVLLLQNKSPVFNGLFESGKHFLEFSRKEELLDLIMNIENKTIEIEKIALEGKKRFEDLYESGNFWPQILN